MPPKLELCGANEIDIRNQRPQLRRNRLFLGRKAGVGGVVPQCRLIICTPMPANHLDALRI